MTMILLALGLVLVVEGLVIALAPSRMEDLLALVARLSPDQRRGLGLAAVAIGVVLIALSRGIGG